MRKEEIKAWAGYPRPNYARVTSEYGDCSATTPACRESSDLLVKWGATPIFDEYWRFASLRQAVFVQRLSGEPPPWTSDPILQTHRFTNPYRFTDRVSQYLIKEVLTTGSPEPVEVIFRCLLFKIFNRISTWTFFLSHFGTPISGFSVHDYASALDDARRSGEPIYSAAYIMPSPAMGGRTKHENHLLLLASLIKSRELHGLLESTSLKDLYERLLRVPSFGSFLAFQYAIDLSYSHIFPFTEAGFVVPGPGAKDGIRKCFAAAHEREFSNIIMWTCATQDEHFRRLGIRFERLAGRPLQPIDCQNLYCELGKYAREAHPGVVGALGRTRIKQRFSTDRAAALPPLTIPPKWQAGPQWTDTDLAYATS